jgi:hypothetical protein
MKKNFLLFFVAFLGLSLSLVSCDPLDDDNQKTASSEAFLFLKTSSNLPASNTGVSTVDVEVGVTTVSTSDRTYSVSIDDSSTADPSEYSINMSSLFIPANSYTGSFTITANFDNIPDGVVNTIVLNLSADDLVVSNDQHTVSIYRVCDSDLAGTYSTLASGNFGDGSGGPGAPYSNLPYTVTLTATASPGVYTISDMSFGLYDLGYGDSSPSGRISDTCNNLTDLGDRDQYNDPFTMSGTVNTSTGVITISWSNTWGDTGNVTLTPQ